MISLGLTHVVLCLLWMCRFFTAAATARCPPTSHGTNCSLTCENSECPGGLCHQTTGNCTECDETGESHSLNYWPVAAGLGVAFIVFGIVFLRCRQSIKEHQRSAFRPAPTSSVREGHNNPRASRPLSSTTPQSPTILKSPTTTPESLPTIPKSPTNPLFPTTPVTPATLVKPKTLATICDGVHVVAVNEKCNNISPIDTPL